tara:strand:+ start:117 stop:383 length:267 start_codon:yes stop_codon:yes gene_type:complete
MIWHQALATIWVFSGYTMIAVCVVICVQDNQVVANKQMVDVVTGVFQPEFQLYNLKFGQVVAVEQDILAVTVVHLLQVDQVVTMLPKQ